MTDVLCDDGSDNVRDDSQEDVMTPAELIAKLEEVSRWQRARLCGVRYFPAVQSFFYH